MKKKVISIITISILFISLLAGCGNAGGAKSSGKKYNIENLGTVKMGDKNFEEAYKQSKDSSFAWIDEIEEDEYLEADKCKMIIDSENVLVFELAIVDKPNIGNDTVYVTYKHDDIKQMWMRDDIIYNNVNYNKNK